jgi:hypothetical protein
MAMCLVIWKRQLAAARSRRQDSHQDEGDESTEDDVGDYTGLHCCSLVFPTSLRL